MKWDKIPRDNVIEQTAKALEVNGIQTIIVEKAEKAKKKVLEMIPQGAEVMTMSSQTLEEINLSSEINNSGRYTSIRNKIYSLDRQTQEKEMKKLGAIPEWTIGSVHAVTVDGQALIASNTGSQLPAYAYGAGHVIWVVGAQKIVQNLEEGIKRIYEYSLPLESERAKKAYGVPGSSVNKILIIDKEVIPGRIIMVLVKEKLGF